MRTAKASGAQYMQGPMPLEMLENIILGDVRSGIRAADMEVAFLQPDIPHLLVDSALVVHHVKPLRVHAVEYQPDISLRELLCPPNVNQNLLIESHLQAKISALDVAMVAERNMWRQGREPPQSVLGYLQIDDHGDWPALRDAKPMMAGSMPAHCAPMPPPLHLSKGDIIGSDQGPGFMRGVGSAHNHSSGLGHTKRDNHLGQSSGHVHDHGGADAGILSGNAPLPLPLHPSFEMAAPSESWGSVSLPVASLDTQGSSPMAHMFSPTARTFSQTVKHVPPPHPGTAGAQALRSGGEHYDNLQPAIMSPTRLGAAHASD